MIAPSEPSRGAVAAWGFWDWAFAAFNAVATTFVFNTYLSGKVEYHQGDALDLGVIWTEQDRMLVITTQTTTG